MKKFAAILLLLCSFSLGFATLAEQPAEQSAAPAAQQLTDEEMSAIEGGRVTAICVNGVWVYLGDSTFGCTGDAMIIIVEANQ